MNAGKPEAQRTARKILRSTPVGAARMSERMAAELIRRRVDTEEALIPFFEGMSDEQARLHFGEEEVVEAEQLRLGLRLFHAWRVRTLRDRLGDRLAAAVVLDVGDTDGLILKDLGKDGIGLNLSPAALHNIEQNGIRALPGDCHALPFGDRSFDVVLCFETLEHVESPHQVLCELARVCRSDGRVFVSIPWVPRTFFHPRQPAQPRGAMHIVELCRDDFAALVTHTPLKIVWEDVCDVFGPPETLAQRLFFARIRNEHIVANGFRRFQFFELAVVNA